MSSAAEVAATDPAPLFEAQLFNLLRQDKIPDMRAVFVFILLWGKESTPHRQISLKIVISSL